VSAYADLIRYRELFGSLFRRDLEAKYKGTVLGVLWSIANPLLLMGIYLVVFSLLWQVIEQAYPGLFLLTGLVLWVFFANSVQAASKSLLEAAPLIRKTRFPRQLVPLSSVATNLVAFAVMLVVVLVLNFAFLPRVRATEWLAIPLALVFVALVAGVSLAVACVTVVFRDVEHLVSALLLPWFFLTPILYTIDNLPGAAADYDWLADLLRYVNFLAPSVDAIRDPLFFGELPRVIDVIYLCVAATLSLALGAYAFSRVDDRMAVEL
jgi:homopolymeric O-antigen transport system permease protein